MEHLLLDTDTGKETTLRCDGTTLVIETNTGGKIKTSSKSFAEAKEASQQFIKKEWELLKKGALLHTDVAAAGEPLLHLFIGGGYTGCLSFVATSQGIYVYRSTSTRDNFGTQDELLRLDTDGSIIETVTLPGLLPWEICYDQSANQLLLDLDHYIYAYDLRSGAFTKLTYQLNQPASFAAVAAGKWAYATHPHFYISSSNGQNRIEIAFEVQIIKGSIPSCASLSANGQLLALHHMEGAIDIIDTTTGAVLRTLQLPFSLVEHLEWTVDGSQLVVQEKYNQMQLHFFDAVTGNEVHYEGLIMPNYSPEVWDFCFNDDHSLLVCLQRTTAFVFDFGTKTFLYSFPVQHCVKTAEIKFIDARRLGVRTDYGCFSIYAL